MDDWLVRVERLVERLHAESPVPVVTEQADREAPLFELVGVLLFDSAADAFVAPSGSSRPGAG